MKKILPLLFSALLLAMLFAFSASALNLNDATIINVGTQVSGSIMDFDNENTHLFELKEAGTLNISVNSNVPYFTLVLYNTNGDKLWTDDAKCNGNTYSKELELTGGNYYLDVLAYNKKYGAYSLKLTFKSANETYFENQGGSNNTIVDAVNYVLQTDKKYVSHIALNDYDDYFKLELKYAGNVTVNMESDLQTVRAEFFDGNGSKAWSEDVKFENGSFSRVVSLNAGTYYFHLQRIGGNYGSCGFDMSFVSANEYAVEAIGGSNNKISVASPVEVNRNIGGLIAHNDTDDYYVLNLDIAGTLNFLLDSEVNSFKVELLDSDGKKNFLGKEEIANCGGFTYSRTLDLTAGTYYVHIYKNKDYYGIYTLNLNFISSNESFVEAQGGSNNTVENATDISTNTLYYGNIGINDISDYYCFSVSSVDNVTLTLTSSVPGFTVRILDSKSTRLLNEETICNGKTYSRSISLTQGIYYLMISRFNEYTGNYSFKLSAASKSLNQKYTSFGSTVSVWALNEVEEAYATGLIPTYLLGTDLTEKINRAEFAAIALDLYEYIANTRVYLGNNPFLDISSNRFVNEIVKASNLGITSGTSDTTFSPNALITREQMATMICRAYKKKLHSDWSSENDYPLKFGNVAKFSDDSKISAYASEAVYFMSSNGIITGIDDSGKTFAPQNIATREQALIISLRCAKNLK